MPRDAITCAGNPPAPKSASCACYWSRGPSTVREVARAMGRETAYTTILKLMQNMTEKRLVVRDAIVANPRVCGGRAQEHTKRQLVADLIDKVFDGSAAQLVMQALAGAKTSPEELRRDQSAAGKEDEEDGDESLG